LRKPSDGVSTGVLQRDKLKGLVKVFEDHRLTLKADDGGPGIDGHGDELRHDLHGEANRIIEPVLPCAPRAVEYEDDIDRNRLAKQFAN
jgi:hypothetical protein